MNKIVTFLLLVVWNCVYSQELTTIRVSVTNIQDEVYIVGNQESLGDWNPQKIKMKKVGNNEHEISLPLTFPATFKFTRGSWDSEGITGNFQNNANLKIQKYTKVVNYEVKGWSDAMFSDYFKFPFKIEKLYSESFEMERTIAIGLPKNFSSNKTYSVIYVLDANTLFEPVYINAQMMSKKQVDDNGVDYLTDNIPEVIVVGIYHNDRGYETMPNQGFNSKLKEDFLLEGSEKLKSYLFEELMPSINEKYNTSGYDALVGHSNTGHFVMNMPFQEYNPFEAIVALSVNGESDYFNDKISRYLNDNEETIFMGYGYLDMGFKELAEKLKAQIQNGQNTNSNLKIEGYRAGHNQLPVLAIPAGIKFIFKGYKSHQDFLEISKMPDFSVENYSDKYQASNRVYGEHLSFTKDDSFTLIELAVEAKNTILFRKLVKYVEANDYQVEKHFLFYFAKELGDIETADTLLIKISESDDSVDYDLTFYNLEFNYIRYFLNQKQEPIAALNFLEPMIKKSDKYKLQFAYQYAKIGLENGINKKKSKYYLNYCKGNFKQNRMFTEQDLETLGSKKK